MDSQPLLDGFDGLGAGRESHLTAQLITCIGNKRALLEPITRIVRDVASRLAPRRLVTADLFSGSGVVARLLKRYSCELYVNDLERYAEVISRCYLANAEELDLKALAASYDLLKRDLHEKPLRPGFIAELYAPEVDEAVRPGERVFYTQRNARFLDTARQAIGALPAWQHPFFLAPLLSEASIHANTAGVFKGFYKDPASGVGVFGGKAGNALGRIMSDIELHFPALSPDSARVHITRADANSIVSDLPELDLAYLDPPYNQHPYGSNYFMLNLLTEYKRPSELSRVSGIPVDWARSRYNRQHESLSVFSELLGNLPAKYMLISFNSEGFISEPQMRATLSRFGTVQVYPHRYNAFRGSRNLSKRDTHVTEYLFLVER
ncbi:MAG: DNA adenine methylase [Spirochaetales bacterium]